jgi:hypothetical protein
VIARRAILLPLIALVLLTAIVAVWMFRRRVAEMRARGIRTQAVATTAQMATLEDTGAADNFRNLFETPLLFVAAALTIYAAALTSLPYVVLAWLYVALRVVHSAIQCTYNKVMHRMRAFIASVFVLWAIWALIAWDLVVLGRG